MSENTKDSDVHPTSDKTWRNTKYDLTKVPLEAARVFYRTRLEISSTNAQIEPWQTIVEVLLGWMAIKEVRRLNNGLDCLIGSFPKESELMSSEFVRGAFHRACADSYIRTEPAFVSEEDALPQHWAMEYVERDASYGYRFWVTEVGASSIGTNKWVLNVRVRYYDDPTYIYQTVTPKRNAPNFIKDLIQTDGLKVICGGMPLRASAIVLTQDNFDLFLEQMIEPERTAPIVVVSRHERNEGEPLYPVDPLKLARLLTGVAVVYALDRNNAELEQSYRYVFDNPAKPAYKYRLVPGCLRIFWGGVDLDEPSEYDYARHRFFTGDALETLGADAIIQNLSAGVSRMFSLKAGEVLSIRSVGYQSSLLRTAKLENNRKALTERLRMAEEKRTSLENELEGAEAHSASLDAYREQIEVLNDLLSTADDEIKELQARQGQTSSGVSEDEYLLQTQSLDQAERDAAEATERAESLEQENSHLRYRIDQLEVQARNEQARSKGSKVRSELLFEVGKELRDPARVISIAQQAFSDRMVILDRAVDSARDYKGDPGEMFDGLSAIYRYLWPMRFGDDGGVNVDDGEFRNLSGFALTFHEGKQTNRNPRLVKQRQVEYHGRTFDISPHVKGGDRRRGFLRIHFCFDSEEKLILIGHCGNHMETDGTSKA